MAKKTDKTSFEDKIERLEEISMQLESDEIGLEAAIKLYEEGIELSKTCIGLLKGAELRITELKKKLAETASEENGLFEE